MKERPRLRDYQKDGVRFMKRAGVTFEGRSINADDMGMGKTPQALVTAVELGATKILVVVPNSLRWNWRREIKKWLPKRNVHVCDGSNKQKIDQIQAFEEGFLIVNIDFIRAMWIDNPKGGKKLARQTEELKTILKVKFHFAIFDEAHRYGNKESLQSHGARWLAHAIPTMTGLTGSPMRGKVTNLWHILHMADKKKWSSFWKWAGVHANAHEGPYGWEMADTATDPAKLARDIAPVFIQRRKEDHLDLPELSHHEVWVRLGVRQRRQYDEMKKEMIVELDSGKKLLAPVILAQMVRLKQIAISPMLLDPSLFPLVYDKFINDEDEENDDIESYMKHAKFQALRDVLLGTDEKIIVFSQWEKTLQIVADLCRRNDIGFVTYTGQAADKTVARDRATGKRVLLDGQRVLKRDYNEHLWKTDDYYQVMLATTSAGGIGLNWTEAGVMVRLDKLWVPDDNDQARDRMHRFGQTKRTTLIDILAEDTIEEKIEKMLKRGQNVNEQVSSLFRSRSIEELL